jgi:hypothetical protein
VIVMSSRPTPVQAFKEVFGTYIVLLLLAVVAVGGAAFCLHARARCRKVCCSAEDDEGEEGSGAPV